MTKFNSFLLIATVFYTISQSCISLGDQYRATDESSTVNNVASDSAITAEIKSKFLADEEINGLSLHVETVNRVVTLTGEATSSHMKNKAISIAREVKGVKEVKSDIKINTKHSEVAEALSDSKITAAVKSKLIADKDINSLSIHVETNHGVVTLTGEVPDKSTETYAIKLAKNVKGVKKVISKLTISY